jgi:membrane protein
MIMAERFQADLLSLRAQGLTYTTLLSLVPFLAVTFSVLKAFGVQNQIEPVLAQALVPLGSDAVEISHRLVDFVNKLQVGVLGAVGLVGLFYTTIALISQIEAAFNHIWRVPHVRSWSRRFSDYISVVVVGPVLVFTAFALLASAQNHWLVQQLLEIKLLSGVFVFVTNVMPFLLLTVAFTFLYRFLPHTQVHLRAALLGGGVAGVLWLLASVAFTAFVASSPSYTAIYSSFAILVLFFLWLYVGWLVILIGAEVAYCYQHKTVGLQEVAFHKPFYQERLALSALVAVTQRHLVGQRPWSVVELAAVLGVPVFHLEELIDEFVRCGFLLRTAEPVGVTLGRAPENITVSEILLTLRGADTTAAIANGEDPVSEILKRRAQVIHQAFQDVTLRSLVTRTSH